MRQSERERRLKALEVQAIMRLPLAERALAKLQRGEPVTALTDAELEAFLDGPDGEYLKALPDTLLDLIDQRPDSEPWLVELKAAYAESTDAFGQALQAAYAALRGDADAPT